MKKTIVFFLAIALSIASCTNNNSTTKETTLSTTSSNNLDSKTTKNNSINYETYVNPRFGFSILYPSFLTPEPEPDNGDGRTFSDDNNEKINVYAQYNAMEYSIEEL